MSFRAIAVLLACASLAACVSVVPEKSTKYVASGESIKIGNYGGWGGDCSPKYFFLKIEKKPTNGKLEITDGTMKIPANPQNGTSGRCAGRKIKSKLVKYKSDDDFNGADSVEMSVQTPGRAGISRFHVSLIVRK